MRFAPLRCFFSFSVFFTSLRRCIVTEMLLLLDTASWTADTLCTALLPGQRIASVQLFQKVFFLEPLCKCTQVRYSHLKMTLWVLDATQMSLLPNFLSRLILSGR